MRCYGGSSRATTAEAHGGVGDDHTDLNNTKKDGKDFAMKAESGTDVADSESRADVAESI